MIESMFHHIYTNLFQLNANKQEKRFRLASVFFSLAEKATPTKRKKNAQSLKGQFLTFIHFEHFVFGVLCILVWGDDDDGIDIFSTIIYLFYTKKNL